MLLRPGISSYSILKCIGLICVSLTTMHAFSTTL